MSDDAGAPAGAESRSRSGSPRRYGRTRTRLLPILGIVVILAVVAAQGHPARPLRGATYHGTLREVGRSADVLRPTIRFSVTASGQSVDGFAIPAFPVGCAGGELFGTVGTGRATVSRSDAFVAVLPIRASDGLRGHVLVTGRFLADGRASGDVSTVLTAAGFARCGAGAPFIASTSN